MSEVRLVRRDGDCLRFLAYNTFCEVLSPGAGDAWDDVLREAERVRMLLDAYDAASELGRTARRPAGEPIPLSRELFDFLSRIFSIARASGGAFDPTVGPLSDAWDFTSPHPRSPSPEELREALSRVGYGFVHLDPASQSLTFLREGMRIDPGAAGKGYAACCIARVLQNRGAGGSVNLGGNLLLMGRGSWDGKWRVGVQSPWDARGRAIGSLLLPGALSVSTSGGYDRFFTENGKLYHHLLDPRTGRPVENDILSATVVDPDPLLADALSTVLFVGGEECLGAVKPGCGYVLVRADGSVTISKPLEGCFSA